MRIANTFAFIGALICAGASYLLDQEPGVYIFLLIATANAALLVLQEGRTR